MNLSSNGNAHAGSFGLNLKLYSPAVSVHDVQVWDMTSGACVQTIADAHESVIMSLIAYKVLLPRFPPCSQYLMNPLRTAQQSPWARLPFAPLSFFHSKVGPRASAQIDALGLGLVRIEAAAQTTIVAEFPGCIQRLLDVLRSNPRLAAAAKAFSRNRYGGNNSYKRSGGSKADDFLKN